MVIIGGRARTERIGDSRTLGVSTSRISSAYSARPWFPRRQAGCMGNEMTRERVWVNGVYAARAAVDGGSRRESRDTLLSAGQTAEWNFSGDSQTPARVFAQTSFVSHRGTSDIARHSDMGVCVRSCICHREIPFKSLYDTAMYSAISASIVVSKIFSKIKCNRLSYSRGSYNIRNMFHVLNGSLVYFQLNETSINFGRAVNIKIFLKILLSDKARPKMAHLYLPVRIIYRSKFHLLKFPPTFHALSLRARGRKGERLI